MISEMARRWMIVLAVLATSAGCQWERAHLPVPVYGDVEPNGRSTRATQGAALDPLPARLDIVAGNVGSLGTAREIALRLREVRDVLVDRRGRPCDLRPCLRIHAPGEARADDSSSGAGPRRELLVLVSSNEPVEARLRLFDEASGALLWQDDVRAEDPGEVSARAVTSILSVEPSHGASSPDAERRVVGIERRPVWIRY